MTDLNKQFLVSVADAIIRDPSTSDAIAVGKANISSAFTLSMAATQVRGGINNPLLYTYMHDRDLKVEIKQATFGKVLLGLNTGSLITSSTVSVVKSECVQLSAGVGTVTETPLGNVTAFLPSGLSQTVTPSSKTITVSGGANSMVTAVYTYTDTVDRIAIETIKPPSIVDLTLVAQIRDTDGIQQYDLQINIPKFQVDGNYTLSFAANGVSEEGLTGFALATQGTTCSTGDVYAYVNWVPTAATSIDYTDIVLLPSSVSFSAAAGTPQTYQLSSYGLRGASYAPANITTSCSYAKVVGGSSHVAVGASNGLITLTSGSAGDVATIMATFVTSSGGSLTDTATVTVTD